MQSTKPSQPKNSTGMLVIVGIIVVILGLIVWGHTAAQKAPVAPADTGTGASTPVSATSTDVTATDPSTLPGIQTSLAPWPAELDNLHARLTDIGLPALAEEGTVLHIHQHLDIYIHGVTTPVAAGLGINEQEGFISPIHVHDTSGIIHVESPTVQTFTLGQFFDIWGVRFTSECIGGYCASATDSLRVYVNGQLYQGDPRELALASHQEIVVAYGRNAELPNPIPASFVFPEGY